ncbi:MobV family relaxase [Hymenobacter sp. HD11105]
MAYAILRIGKIKSHSSATSKTQHNYRLQLTPNADPEQQHSNQEYLNHALRNYWDLAQERIHELGLTRLRGDAVRAVEVLLTASPEAFRRDAQGRAADMRASPWVKDNLYFLQQRFGARNVVSFTLHQDEVTPHVHAVIIPVTADGRLSSRDVFSPKSLRQLQTDYAQAMAPYGMARGVQYSTAIHQDVRRNYGAQQTSKEQLAQVATPLEPAPFAVGEMKWHEHLHPQDYVERELARLNAHLAEQVALVNAKLAEVAQVATANTMAQERARVMEKRVAKAEQTLQAREKQLLDLQTKLSTAEATNAKLTSVTQQLAVRWVQGEMPGEPVVAFAEQVRSQAHRRIEQAATEVLQGPLRSRDELEAAMQDKGYRLRFAPQTGMEIICLTTGTRMPREQVRPNGQSFNDQVEAAVARTQAELRQQNQGRSIRR